jgi:hypothetical protein
MARIQNCYFSRENIENENASLDSDRLNYILAGHSFRQDLAGSFS